MPISHKSIPLLLVLSLLPGDLSSTVLPREIMPTTSHHSRRVSMEQLLKRSEVPAENRWKLEDVFASQKDWDAEFAEAKSLIKKAADFQGTLDSADALKNVLSWMTSCPS